MIRVMSARAELHTILGLEPGNAEKIAPLLADAASALAEVKVPTENEIHELASGAYRFTQTSSLESEDTDRRFEEAMKNLSKWRESPQVFMNGASVFLRRLRSGTTRYDAKKRVLAALRGHHASPAADHFYFTRETGAEIGPDFAAKAAAPLAVPPATGHSALVHPAITALLGSKPEALSEEQRDLLVRLLAIPSDPRSPDAGRIVALLAKCGETVGPSILRALHRPEDCARNVGGESGELLIGIRQVLPRLPEVWSERILRAALEAGWSEWIDRPLLDPPIPVALREKLLKEFGTRQDPRGNPYRPTEAWFYNLDPS